MMSVSMSDRVAKVAFDPSVRRMVQGLPQHQLIQSDERFDDLLDRLAQSERESASPHVSESHHAASAALDVVPSSLVEC